MNMNPILQTLLDALDKLEVFILTQQQTSKDSETILQSERLKREEISEQIKQAEEELSRIVQSEEQMIQTHINQELEKPLEIGRKFQEKLIKKLNDATILNRERTYVVDELSHEIVNMRNNYFMLERQLQKSQATVQDYGVLMNDKQQEYLELQIVQAQKSKEMKELEEEITEMKELLQKVKEIQFTLNKVIRKPKLNQTNSTEENYKDSFLPNSRVASQHSKQEEFWYQLPPTPPIKLPRIK